MLAALAACGVAQAQAQAQSDWSVEEKSLISANGTYYTVRAGKAAALGVIGSGITPEQNLIAWSLRRQDGSQAAGVIPGTIGITIKKNLLLTFDETTQTLVLVSNEADPSNLISLLRLAILRDGRWTSADLPATTGGFSHASNPQIELVHPTENTVDATGKAVACVRSALVVTWYEDYAGSRLASFFIDEDLRPEDVYSLDLDDLVNGAGTSRDDSVPAGEYMYPSLQAEGNAVSMSEPRVLVSFTSLAARKHVVARASFPIGGLTTQRRHAPIVGVTSVGEAPLAFDANVRLPATARVETIIGSGTSGGAGASNPALTVYWRSDSGQKVSYTYFDGRKWSSVKTLTGIEPRTAVQLIREMAARQ